MYNELVGLLLSPYAVFDTDGFYYTGILDDGQSFQVDDYPSCLLISKPIGKTEHEATLEKGGAWVQISKAPTSEQDTGQDVCLDYNFLIPRLVSINRPGAFALHGIRNYLGRDPHPGRIVVYRRQKEIVTTPARDPLLLAVYRHIISLQTAA